MVTKLYKMIREGEHQRQDFKYCISDSRKIARSLVAFANSEGGSLLIGVKDNGHIVGVQSEEEYYMAESAARIYSNPPIPFTVRQWNAEGKTVLEVKVEPSTEKPHFARDENGRWSAWVRHHDENKLTPRVLIDSWKKQKSKEGVLVRYDESWKFLLEYLDRNEFISVSALARKGTLPYRKAELLIADCIVIGIVQPIFTEKGMLYKLNRQFDLDAWKIKEKIRNK